MTIQFPRREKQPDGSFRKIAPAFWLVDTGKSLDQLMAHGRRFSSEEAARDAMAPTDGLIKVFPRPEAG